MMQDVKLQLAVPMTCESCATDIRTALEPLGVSKVDCDVATNSVIVHGDVAPSAIVNAISGTGRDVIVRGTGAPNSAAVCILEDTDGKPHGLVRLVQMSDTVVDLSVSESIFDRLGPSLVLSAQQYGDISNGALSTGPTTDKILELTKPSISSYSRVPLSVSCLIGRALILTPPTGPTNTSLAGIVARSAGMWELDKTVCSCTGKTMWQETRVN